MVKEKIEIVGKKHTVEKYIYRQSGKIQRWKNNSVKKKNLDCDEKYRLWEKKWRKVWRQWKKQLNKKEIFKKKIV